MKNQALSDTIRKKYAEGWSPRKGKTHSDETKKRISEIKKEQAIVPKTAWKKGITAWNKGMKCEWTRTRNIVDNPTKIGEEHWNWHGDNVKYRGLHKWVQKKLGIPDECSVCGKTNLFGHSVHWANLSHEYKREISDWARMCAKCHGAYDKNKRSNK